MLLYICEHCNKWQDVSLAKKLADAFKNVPGVEQLSGVACPSGCGLMREIKPTDRLCVVEAVYKDSIGTIRVEIKGKHYKGDLYEVNAKRNE